MLQNHECPVCTIAKMLRKRNISFLFLLILYIIIYASSVTFKLTIKLICIQKRGAKRKSNVNRLQIPKDTEGKTPIIVYKKKELNFYEGQKYSKLDPIPLASKGWHHYKSKGDHFFVYPLTNV